jgi:preprotein translocase subunit SecA
MSADDVAHTVADMRHQVIEDLVARDIPENAYPEQWNMHGLHGEIFRIFNLDLPLAEWAKEEGIADAEIRDRLLEAADRRMAEKAANFGPDTMRMIEKSLLLQILDQVWKEHLLALDHLRQGIGLRAYAQRDPLNEYKREAFDLFQAMLERLRERVTLVLAHVELRRAPAAEPALRPPPPPEMHETRADPAFAEAEDEPGGATATVRSRQAAGRANPSDPSTWGRVARNAPCPCGSGKKYKHCHGQLG